MFFSSAQRVPFRLLACACLPCQRSLFHMPRRTSSNALVAHCTTWKASRQIRACGARSFTALWIHSAPSADTCVNAFDRSGPRSSKKRSSVSVSRPGAAHTSRPVAWSTITVKYRCPLRCAISSMPILVSPSRRSLLPDRSATTLVTIAATVRQVTRSNADTTVIALCAASHAQVSSNARVCRAFARAHGTAATITPCSGQVTRGASASRNACTVPRSRVRHRRRPSPASRYGHRRRQLEQRNACEATGRTAATSTSSPRLSSLTNSTPSTTVCSTPSRRRNTLTLDTPFSVLGSCSSTAQKPIRRTARRLNDQETSCTGTAGEPEECPLTCLALHLIEECGRRTPTVVMNDRSQNLLQ